MMKQTQWIATSLMAVLLSVPALAQNRSALDAAIESPADQPLTAVVKAADAPADAQADAQTSALIAMLTGSHLAAPGTHGDHPAMWLHFCPITVTGLSNTLYFEISRADDASNPFQQGVMQAMRVRDGLRLRLHSFEGTVGDPLVGLWTRPEAMPEVDRQALSIVTDIPLSPEQDAFSGRTPCAYPVAKDGAIEATSALRIKNGSIVLEDEGLDASGQRVWGLTGDRAPNFKRQPLGSDFPVRAEVRENELLILHTKPPEADSIAHVEGGEVVVHYSGWLTNGRLFDTSRQAGREPLTLRLPGQVITGWSEGLKGIGRGERRRLVIPPGLAYGARGRPGVIPANATLVFEVECLQVNNDPPSSQPPTHTNPGHTSEGQSPPPRPAPAPPAPER